MKRILVNGAGGFIGGHLVKRLKREGFWVRGVDLKYNEFSRTPADEFIVADLRDQGVVRHVVEGIDEVAPRKVPYQPESSLEQFSRTGVA